MMMKRVCGVIAVVLVAAPGALAAQSDSTPVPYGKTFTARHTVTCGGTRLPLVATMKSTIVVDSAGAPAVSFVSFAYVRDDVRDRSDRPVIFGFGGGPTGAAMGYHMYLIGPKVIRDPAHEPGATFNETLLDNAHCIFDVADAVMIDPAESGFSRILPGGKKSYYFSVAGDLASIGQFIRTWMKENGREASPLYILGGSYGSVRTVRLAWDLRNTAKPVDGIIMTANSTMIQELAGALGVATSLPTMTMTALHHGKIDRRGRSDSAIMAEAYKWSMTEYLGALHTFNDMTAAERASWAEELAGRTGISAAHFLANNLAISGQLFSRELLKAEGRVLNNPNDARATAPAPPPPVPGQAPSARGPAPAGGGASRPATSRAFASYMKDYLGVTYPMSEYWESTPGTDWDYSGPPEARTAIGRNDWAKMLRETMEVNPRLRVYSVNGYQDMLTTAGQARLLFSRNRLPRDRITIREYPGGHPLQRYLPTAALIARDIRQFLMASSQ
jgi:carboxypeptidase C (cathepsin A)